jgi:hypothetical protein
MWRRWILITTHCPRCMLTKERVQLRGPCPFTDCALGLQPPLETFTAKWPKHQRGGPWEGPPSLSIVMKALRAAFASVFLEPLLDQRTGGELPLTHHLRQFSNRSLHPALRGRDDHDHDHHFRPSPSYYVGVAPISFHEHKHVPVGVADGNGFPAVVQGYQAWRDKL